MELKEFITEVLVAIVGGVEGAKSRVEEYGGKINPRVFPRGGGRFSVAPEYKAELASDMVQIAEFDVAVGVSNEKEKGGKFGISVCGINVGGGGDGILKTSTVSRIKFSVPYKLP